MKCIEAQQLVKPYLEKELSDRDLEQFLDHIATCPDCYDELEIYFSIYQTLAENDSMQETERYDFEQQLTQDIRASKRYLKMRKSYRVFRFTVVMLAELLLLMTVLTGIEIRRELGSHGTTIYKMFYGREETVKVTEAEPDQKDEMPAKTIEQTIDDAAFVVDDVAKNAEDASTEEEAVEPAKATEQAKAAESAKETEAAKAVEPTKATETAQTEGEPAK